MNKKPTDVLVLNRSWAAIHIVIWKKAMSLIYQGAANPIDRDFAHYNFERWLEFSTTSVAHDYPKVHTTRWEIAVPEIIVLDRYNRLPQRDVKYSRQSLFERDNFRCYLCGKKFDRHLLTVDHLIPRCKGGGTSWANTVTACKTCNSAKGDKMLSQLNIEPFFMPSKPKWIGPLHKVRGHKVRESWRVFMKKQYIDPEK